MDENRLKMNNAKTEFVLSGSCQQLAKCSFEVLNVNGELIQKSTSIKYLGIDLDQELSMKEQIARKCRIASFNLRRIRNIRKYLTRDACLSITLGLVISHLDYANGVYMGLPDCEISCLQRIQNFAAKTILNKSRIDSACLKGLPIRLHINFKILTLVYKCVYCQAPSYLCDLIK